MNEVIEVLTKSIKKNLEEIKSSNEPVLSIKDNGLDSLNDAEAYEPEFTDPVPIDASEIKSKLIILHKNSFFNTPRTVSETIEQLREYGWHASPFDVSKTLANMALNKEILKNSQENKNYYFVKEPLIVT